MIVWAVAAWAGSEHVRVEVGPDGPPDRIEVLSADGRVLHAFAPEDPRIRSIALPGGGGETARLPHAVGRYEVPWPEGARALRVGGRPLARLPPPPTGEGIAVQQSGPPSERLDLLFLGDGYTADQQARFAADVDAVVGYLAEIDPWGEYTALLNIWRVDTASAEAGVTHLETAVGKETAYGCYYGCGGIDRLVCCDDVAVLDAADSVGPVEGVIVLINDPTYGGSGGFTYATAYNGEFGLEVAAHELGHSLVLLRDEYSYYFTDLNAFPGPNCSNSETDLSWAHWLGVDGVDAYSTCSYDNFWRPTENNCMMRTLDAGYCPVCREAAVLALYQRIPDLLAGTQPPAGEIVDATVEDASIVVETIVSAGQLVFEWSVDGEVVPDLGGAVLDPKCRPELAGEVTVRVFDPTPWVREDPSDLLQSVAGPWTVRAAPCAVPGTDRGDAPCGCASPAGATGWLVWLAPWLIRRRGAR